MKIRCPYSIYLVAAEGLEKILASVCVPLAVVFVGYEVGYDGVGSAGFYGQCR